MDIARLLSRTIRLGSTTALIACVATGIVLLAGILVPRMFGARAIAVTSGSMAPAISTGDAVIVDPVPPSDIEHDDIIVFRPIRSERLTTHRVVDVITVGGVLHFQTKGDGNASIDPDLAPAPHVIGRVAARLPWFGYLAGFARSTTGKVVLLALPTAIVVIRQARALLGIRRRAGEVPA